METEIDIQDPRVWLSEELTKRKLKNPSYSLAAFSRSLGLSCPTLSQVLSGKRPLSRKAVSKIVEHLNLAPEAADRFWMLAMKDRKWVSSSPKSSEPIKYRELAMDQFELISNWYYYAILSLAHIRGNRLDPKWIAQRLGIQKTLAEKSVDRLLRLGLIQKKGRGFFQTDGPIWVSTQKNSSAIRKFHGDVLRKAQETLQEQSAPLERFTSMVLAVDEKNIEKGRNQIRKLREKVAHALEKGNPNCVYALAIQLIPLCRGDLR